MNVLKNKSKKDYDYTSRYSSFPYYFNSNDKKYVYGLTGNLSSDTEYVIHMISDVDTLDSLALKYYGRPDLYWVIADYNRIRDPYIKLIDKYNFIYVPSLSGLRFNK